MWVVGVVGWMIGVWVLYLGVEEGVGLGVGG